MVGTGGVEGQDVRRDEVYWRYPSQSAPPIGRKLLLLTEGGVAVVGEWKVGGGFTAWSPLPKKPVVSAGKKGE